MSEIIFKNVDCLPFMMECKENEFDLAIVDPPYFEGPNKSGYYGKGYSSLGVQRFNDFGTAEFWEVPRKEYFWELFRISKNQIIFGANHFADRFKSDSSGWIIWDKENGKSSFADAELAFTSFAGAVRIYRYMWNGMHQGSFGGDVRKNEKRIHPTQKPISLYKWILQNYANPGDKIFDSHLGSGSIACACHDLEFDLVGCEIDPKYFQMAKERLKDHQAQLSLRLEE